VMGNHALHVTHSKVDFVRLSSLSRSDNFILTAQTHPYRMALLSYTGARTGQFSSACASFPSRSFKQGAKNISPVYALLMVPQATIIQRRVTAIEKTYHCKKVSFWMREA
jgi:hypothetical protein